MKLSKHSLSQKFSILIFIFLFQLSKAQPCKDGNEVISTPDVVFNRYTTLNQTSFAGNSSIVVGNIFDLSASAIPGGVNNPYTTGSLSPFDLLMIIKIQGASINNTNTNLYGDITSYNGVGQYEFAEVLSISGNTITLVSPTINSYNVSSTERVQVIRIPRLNGLIVNSGASLTSLAWGVSGNIGGVVSVETSGNILNDGLITVKGKGFRGGKFDLLSGSGYGITDYINNTNFAGAEKGEGIAGFQTDYDAIGGRYCKGAPANGGGGGNAHNAAGGGGSNAGSLIGYTGNGIPDISNPTWIPIWNLESPGFSSTTSPGGGRGGYSFGNSASITSDAPGNPVWGGDSRRSEGGFGGRPLDNVSDTRLFFGGGGGAGDDDDFGGGEGGSGGGIIFLVSRGTISGTGQIVADGEKGGDAIPITFNDAPGGGGGGGSIVLLSQVSINGISISSIGGNGGNQIVPGGVECEGGGGGGGGGYIKTTTTSVLRNSNGGVNGTSNSPSVSSFPQNGATSGAVGNLVNNTAFIFDFLSVDLALAVTENTGPFCIGSIKSYTFVVSNVSECIAATNVTVTIPSPSGVSISGSSASMGTFTSPFWTIPSLAAGASATLTITGSIIATSISSTTASVSSSSTEYVLINNSVVTNSSTVSTVTINISSSPSFFCLGSSSTLTATGALTYTWSPSLLIGSSIVVSPSVNTTYTVTGTNINGCIDTKTLSVIVNALPTLTISPIFSTICVGSITTLLISGASTYTWSTGAHATNITVGPSVTSTYSVSGTNTLGCINTATALVTVNPLPALTITPTSTNVCAGNSTILSASGASSYTWNPSGIVSSSISVTPTVSTTYTVIGINAFGCISSRTITVNVNPIPSMTISPIFSSICVGSITTLLISGAATYTWSTGSNATNITVGPTVTTTYSVSGTNSNGCVNTATALVTVNALPTITISPSPIILCSGSSVVLNAIGALTYTWNPSGIISNSISVSPSVSTTYSVIGENSFGCKNTQTVNVIVNSLPSLTINPMFSSICVGSITTLLISGASTYTWSNGSNATNITVSPTVTTTYSVTGTNSVGCTNTATALVTVNNLPIVNATPISFSVCNGSSTIINASGTAVSYTWNPSAVVSNSILVSPTSLTVYTLSGTDINGCVNSNTTSIGIYPSSLVSISVPSNTICIGNSVTLTAIGAVSYTWIPSLLVSPSITDSPIINTTYTLNGIDVNGCSNTSTTSIYVSPLPSGTFTCNLNMGCAPLKVDFLASSSDIGDTYQWEFINPLTASGNSASFIYNKDGSYDVKLTITNSLGCTTTVVRTGYVIVYPKPIAQFYAVPPTNSVLDPNINFVNTSSLATSYYWDFGDPTSSFNNSTLTNPSHYYETSNLYEVNLVATSINGCSDTARIQVEITPEFVVYIPNTFTPDENNVNDIFYVYGIGIDEENYKMRIFDRWGELIYFSDVFKKGWNGIDKNDAICKQDVYTYKIEIFDYKGVKHDYVGHINLIR